MSFLGVSFIHIPDAEKALDELARIVKPGGKLALYITNKTAVDHSRVSSIDPNPVRAYRMQEQFVTEMLDAIPADARLRLSGLSSGA